MKKDKGMSMQIEMPKMSSRITLHDSDCCMEDGDDVGDTVTLNVKCKLTRKSMEKRDGEESQCEEYEIISATPTSPKKAGGGSQFGRGIR
jgi:hypothetical protein